MSSPESIKVVLIGESQVRKTCIIARFLEGKFVSKTKPSLTAQYAKKVITLPDKKTLTFDLWDTAGEEKFRAMARIFLNEAKKWNLYMIQLMKILLKNWKNIGIIKQKV